MRYILDNNRLKLLAHSDESQLYSGDLVAELAAKILALHIRIDKAEAENKRLRIALESLRETKHYECEDCFYSCPKTGACFKEVPDYAECTCGMDRRNAIIDKALKGGE